MPTLTLHFRKHPRVRGAGFQRSWFRDICSFCTSIYGEETHNELREEEARVDLMLRDYVDMMLTTALPECRIHHDSQEVEVQVDFDSDADIVAFYLRHVDFDPS